MLSNNNYLYALRLASDTGFGQLNQTSPLSSTLNSGLNSGINMGSALGAGTYQHYGLNALGRCAPHNNHNNHNTPPQDYP